MTDSKDLRVAVTRVRRGGHSVLYLSAKDLLDLAPAAVLVEAVQQALRDFARSEVAVPVRQHLDFGDSTLLLMPVISERAFGAKIVSVVPSNRNRNIPVTNGLMILSEGSTGTPTAVLNAAALTAQRTGAVGALGLSYITPSDSDCIGIIGTGVQGAWQAISACAVRPIKTIYYVSRTDESSGRFASVVAQRVESVQLTRCRDADDLLAKCETVIAATTSVDPVLPGTHALLENKHFISIGSFKPAMQELPSAVYELARCAVIDSDAARHEAGDLINPLSTGMLREENVFHLAELVTGARNLDVRRTTVFKSVGMALYDLYTARALVDAARRLGRGTVLDL